MALLGNKIGDAFIEVGASFAGFGKNLGSEVTRSLISQTSVVGTALEGFGRAVFAKFSVPLIAATTANLAQFQQLDRGIREVLTLFNTAPSLVSDSFEQIQEGIRGVAREVGGLESDIADGLYQTISAGIPRGQAFEFLEVAQMAAFADKTSDLTTAVDGLSTVVNAFGLEAKDAERIADAMFKTVALGKTTFGELGSDIGRVAPLAANAGVAFEELLAVVGSMTLQGLSTAEAISFIRAAITGLLRPSADMDAIFRAIGHASAEAAIPVIGLQSAFQAVFNAAGGSTSRLQELIGTSEGVTAALAVTGDNAGKFTEILDSIGNSTGTAANAFAIMDQSVGRGFGRLTESFDRLGNSFGELTAKFADPIFRGLAQILDLVADNFGLLEPAIRGLSTAFATLISVFNLPVIRDVTAGFISMGIAVSGLIGVFGLAALAAGKFLSVVAATAAGKTAIKLFVLLQTHLKTAMLTASAAAGNLATRLGKSLIPATSALGTVAARAQKGLALLSLNAKAAAIGTGLIGAAAIAAVLAVGKYIESQKKLNESLDIYGKQIDVLLESTGLLNEAIALPNAKEGEQNIASFEEQNRFLLGTLRQIQDTMGEAAAIDFGEGILASLVLHGNAPEQVLAVAETLERLTGLNFESTISGLSNTTSLINDFATGVDVASDRFENFLQSKSTDLGDGLRDIGSGVEGLAGEINNLTTPLVELFSLGRQSGDMEPFLVRLAEIREVLKTYPGLAEQFGGALNKAFQEQLGVDDLTGFFTSEKNLLDPDFLMRMLANQNLTWTGPNLEIPTTFELGDPTAFNVPTPFNFEESFPEQNLADAQRFAEEFNITLAETGRLGEDGRATMDRLADGIDAAFTAASDHVTNAISAIRENVMSQMPLLDIYGGKIEQSFKKWKKGQDRFQADIQAVTTLRQRLIDENLPQELIDAFDRTPLDKQAWLAGLGDKQLEIALQELRDSFELTDDAARDRTLQSFDGIMLEAQDLIREQYGELQDDAALAGPLIAKMFDVEFGKAAAHWPITAGFYMAQVAAVMSGVTFNPNTLPGGGFAPDVAGPGAGGGRDVGATHQDNTFNQEFNIYNPTGDVVEDVRRAMAVARTSRVGTPNGRIS